MSLSKEKLAVADADLPRQPKCTRCRHHGVIVRQKGHMKRCPFLKCACSRCLLVTERTRITALQRNLKGAQPNKHTGTSESGVAVTVARSPPDLLSGPAAGGEHVSDSTDAQASPSTEERGFPYFGELRPSAAVPYVQFPFRMSGHYSSSCAPCLPPVPAGLYNHGLYRPAMFPHFQQGAVYYPPPPEPGPSIVFFTLQPPLLPEAFQEEVMSTPPTASSGQIC